MVRQIRASLSLVKTPQDASALGRALRKSWPDKRIKALIAAAGEDVERGGSRPWLRSRKDARKAAAEYDAAKLVDDWSTEATGLITSVRDEVARAMRSEIVEALRVGTDPTTLAARWASKGIPVEWGTLEGRTKVIAQHQLSVLHARVQRERATAVGASQFWWRDQGDTNVRDLHRDLANGGPYDYADPKTQGEGLPGEPVGCRCWAETIVPEAIAAELSVIFG